MPSPNDLVRASLTAGLDQALALNDDLVRRHVARIRRRRPEATPAEVVAALEKQYVATVAGLGAASGGSAAVPGMGTAASLATSAVEVGAFLQASMLFVLAVAAVHDITVDDVERRRTLLFAVLLGNSGSATVNKMAGRTAPHWGRALVRSVPIEAIRSANRVLGRNFVTRYGTQQGILVLGRQVPFGLGAIIGAGGNGALGWITVKAARAAFGPPPEAQAPAAPPAATPPDGPRAPGGGTPPASLSARAKGEPGSSP